MVGRLGRMVRLVRPSLLLVPDLRRVTLMRNRRGWLSPTWRTGSPPRRRWLAIRRRRSTVSMILKSAPRLIVGGVLVHHLVIVLRLVRPFETRRWSLLPRSRFSSSKRFPWRWSSCSQDAWLRRIRMMLVLLVSITWTWRWWSVVGDGPDFRRRTVSPAVGRHRPRRSMIAGLVVHDSGAWSAIASIVDPRRSRWLRRRNLWLW